MTSMRGDYLTALGLYLTDPEFADRLRYDTFTTLGRLKKEQGIDVVLWDVPSILKYDAPPRITSRPMPESLTWDYLTVVGRVVADEAFAQRFVTDSEEACKSFGYLLDDEEIISARAFANDNDLRSSGRSQ